MAQLIGMSADVKGRSYTLEQYPFTIGRSEDCDVKLENASVSSRHCSIMKMKDTYTLVDAGSTNGTRVNNKPITEVVLKHKDLVQIGSVEFIFNIEGAGVEESSTTASFAPSEVLVSEAAVEAPQTFNSISPFGTREKNTQGKWVAILIVVGLVALGLVGYLLYTLFKS